MFLISPGFLFVLYTFSLVFASCSVMGKGSGRASTAGAGTPSKGSAKKISLKTPPNTGNLDRDMLGDTQVALLESSIDDLMTLPELRLPVFN